MKLLLPVIAILLLLPACVDEIPLPEPGEERPPVVIQGRVSKGDPSLLQVRLSLAASFSAADFPPRITGAEVLVVDRDGTRWPVPEVEAGLYERRVGAGEPQAIETDRAYQLQVTLPDGRTYHSDFETVLPVPRPDSLSYQVVTRTEINAAENIVEVPILQVFLHSPLSAPGAPEPSALKWDFSGVWQLRETNLNTVAGPRSCFVEQPVNLEEVVVLDGRTVNADYLDRRLLFEEPVDHRFALGYFLTVIQHSISPAAYTYWSRIAEVTERSGGLFEKPPASVPGNIRNTGDPGEKVLGFFYAGAADTLRQRVSLSEDLAIGPNCPPNLLPGVSANDLSKECVNCLEWPNSTLEKPPYWE